MASSFANASAAAALLLVCGGPAFGQKVVAPPGIQMAADSTEIDARSGKVDFRGLSLTQNDLHIAANRATATAYANFEDSTWQLSDVRISAGSTRISADEATLNAKSDKLATLELRGKPATFEETAPGKSEPIKGGAGRIEFDNEKHTLSMTDDAWLSIGGNEIRYCNMLFDLSRQTYSTGTGCKEQVRITIAPEQKTQPPAGQPQ